MRKTSLSVGKMRVIGVSAMKTELIEKKKKNPVILLQFIGFL